MTRIAFLLNFPLAYKGGINYLKNLLYAIKEIKDKNFEIILFVPGDIPQEYINIFSRYAELIKTNVIRRRSLVWFIDKVCQKYLNYGPLTELLLKKNRVNVISHSNYVSKNRNIRSINWIPDFQYLHYPDLWSDRELINNKRLHENLANESDVIVLSSNDAFKDYKTLYPSLVHKVKVLHFVSQPTSDNTNLLEDELLVVKKYADNAPFFYLPNQFWSHKNHILAFKAVKQLKDRGWDMVLLTSGVMEDFRSKNDHIGFLRKYVEENHLSEMIKFLGVIPYSDVLILMKYSKAVINPSFFEGWSSTVEEARTLGVSLLLSDIPVHREQSPPNSDYIDLYNEEELANVMEKYLINSNTQIRDIDLLKQSLDQRTISFGNTYLNIVKELG
ncbi:hypothetical protein DBR11_26715 [Pedobacter sp. HMWF019]|uniref:glycosyltransferase n=1 Tax=Pedobacter sp. HMWF019 TaxID=2056856 RepID=UPI000D3B63CF|nr:glycosyltransferase [Pedobacter sp. HMWF019]PTS92541.1 hypothetical protein DBR11_26715 [Pedobacter sp. HMWF019]